MASAQRTELGLYIGFHSESGSAMRSLSYETTMLCTSNVGITKREIFKDG